MNEILLLEVLSLDFRRRKQRGEENGKNKK